MLAGATLLAAQLSLAGIPEAGHYEDRSEYRAPFAVTAPTVDGVANESVWAEASWRELDKKWLGPDYTETDFQGRFKVAWTADRLFLLVEIVDDVLIDTHRDPLVQYWDDDCLEVFLDEDFSGGEHQHNHNAFAYHMSLDNQAIDIGTNGQAQNYSHHVESRWQQYDGKLVWELAIVVYTDEYVDGGDANRPVVLNAGKVVGLMVAYCDNDGSEIRENFIGSESVPHGPKDRGWIDAGLFGALILVEQPGESS